MKQSDIASSNVQTIDRNNPQITIDREYDARDSIMFSYTTTDDDDQVTYNASATIENLLDGKKQLLSKGVDSFSARPSSLADC